MCHKLLTNVNFLGGLSHFFVEFNGNKSWLNNKNKRTLGSKTVGGLLKDQKMASGQRAPIAVGQEDRLLERQFKVIKLDLRYVAFLFY